MDAGHAPVSAPDKLIPVLSEGHFEATPLGLKIVGEPSLEEWISYGGYLKRVARAVYWLLGDWLQYGIVTYQDWEQAMDGIDYGTLRNYKYVAVNVPLKNRRDPEELSFGHHAAVAPLNPDDQPEWLEKAYVGGWSPTRLRREIKGRTWSAFSKCSEDIRRLREILDELIEHSADDSHVSLVEVHARALTMGSLLDDMEGRIRAGQEESVTLCDNRA